MAELESTVQQVIPKFTDDCMVAKLFNSLDLALSKEKVITEISVWRHSQAEVIPYQPISNMLFSILSLEPSSVEINSDGSVDTLIQYRSYNDSAVGR